MLHTVAHVIKCRRVVQKHNSRIRAAMSAARVKKIDNAVAKATAAPEPTPASAKKRKKLERARITAMKQAMFTGGGGGDASTGAGAGTAVGGAGTRADDAYEVLEFKDQGFTRAKVLVILPFRHSALEFVRTMIKMFGLKVSCDAWCVSLSLLRYHAADVWPDTVKGSTQMCLLPFGPFRT